jgi:hypothetical protein
MYDNAVKSFDNFRINHNFPVTWPPSINPLLQYIGYMSVNGFALSIVRSYLSGINFNLKIPGFSDLTDNFIIKKMLDGYDKLNKRCDIRKPITLDLKRFNNSCPIFFGLFSAFGTNSLNLCISPRDNASAIVLHTDEICIALN